MAGYLIHLIIANEYMKNFRNDIKNKKIFRVEGNPSRKKFVEDSRMKFT